MAIAIDSLTHNKKTSSYFTLVLALARRATEVNSGSPALVKTHTKKPSTIAMEEFKEGKVDFEQEI